jgi:DNA primase
MKFPPEFLDEIRARLPVSEVAGTKVKLRKEGREWRGLSPFTAEKTPSFFVNDQKGFFHDFSSGKHGDAFAFLMETEGLTFPEAVERLAGMAGLPMPRPSSAEAAQDKKRATLIDVVAMAVRLFEANLQGPVGAKARGYLADRGLGAPVQQRFGLGYASGERFALRDALAAQGAGVEAMIEAGLLVHGQDIAVPYDRFRDRVMFPIHDRSGRVIAFGGRAMEAGAKAKYLNSPETALFHKGALLFNHHRARKAAHEAGAIIVVEGYIDAIATSEAGFPNVVAPLGTALTPDQCALLWAMATEPILCFDGDGAGRRAAFRAIETALPLIGAGKSLRFALLPEGQDPDDLIRLSGPAAIAEHLNGAKPLADMLFMRETDGERFDTPEQRAALERRLGEAVTKIADETLRRHYHADMKRRLSAFFGEEPGRPARGDTGARAGFGPRRGGSFPPRGPRVGLKEAPLAPQTKLARKAPLPAREIMILSIALSHPALVESYCEELAATEFIGAGASKLRDALLAAPAGAMASPATLAEWLKGAGNAEGRDRILGLAEKMPNWWCMRPEAAPADAEQVLQQNLLLQQGPALHRELKLAVQAFEAEQSELNFARVVDIKAKLAELADAKAAIDGFGDGSGRATSAI